MEHGASLNTLDISDETILAALEEKNEVVQTRRASLPGACKKTSANNLSQEESVKPSSRQRNTVAAKEKTSAENCDLRWRAERKTFTSTSWKDTEPGTRKETWKQRTINLLLPGSLFRTILAPMPTMTIHFVLFVFVCLSLILTWWRPCTLGHFNLTCMHRRAPSPPFNCFVPLALYFAPFTTLFINLTSNVPFLFLLSPVVRVIFRLSMHVNNCPCFFFFFFLSNHFLVVYISWQEGPGPKTFGMKRILKLVLLQCVLLHNFSTFLDLCLSLLF